MQFLSLHKLGRPELRALLGLAVLLALVCFAAILPRLISYLGIPVVTEAKMSESQLLPFILIIMTIAVFGVTVIYQQARYRALQVSNYVDNHAALHDPLTGSANRRQFEILLEQLVAEKAPSHALIMLDLDRFKPVNDLYGHAAGDALLTEIAEGLEKLIGPKNLLARLGGDEFVLLLSETSDEASDRIALALLEFVTNYRLNWQGERISVGTSIGLVNINRTGLSAKVLLGAADEALYSAKEAGRGAAFRATLESDVTLKPTVLRIDDAIPEPISSARSCVPQDGRRQELHAMVMAWTPPKEAPGYYKRKGSRRRHEIAHWVNIEPLTIGDSSSPGIKMRELLNDAAARNDGGADLARWILTTALNAASGLTPTTMGRIGFVLPLPGRAVAVPDLAGELMHLNALAPLPIRHLTFVLHDIATVYDSPAIKEFHERLSASEVQLGFEIRASTLDVLAPMRYVQYDELHLGRELVKNFRPSTRGNAAIESLLTVAEQSATTLVASGADTVEEMRHLTKMGVSRIAGTAVASLEPLHDVLGRLKTIHQVS